jgi:monoamine oxidase
MALCEEWENESYEQYRIHNGHGKLTDYLAAKCVDRGCEIRTGQCIHHIAWGETGVSVKSLDGETHRARKVLLTIPLSLFHQDGLTGAIRFEPGIPAQISLFKKIGFGSVIKLLLLFRKPFWRDAHKEMGFVFSDQAVPTWWTRDPQHGGLLTGWWANTDVAERLSEKEILHAGMQSLANLFSIPADILHSYLETSFIIDWKNELYSGGAYSFAMPGSAAAIKKLLKPVANTLFFAGEALYAGKAPGTVEAALSSGMKAASQISASL